jgi:hypothetical protein
METTLMSGRQNLNSRAEILSEGSQPLLMNHPVFVGPATLHLRRGILLLWGGRLPEVL